MAGEGASSKTSEVVVEEGDHILILTPMENTRSLVVMMGTTVLLHIGEIVTEIEVSMNLLGKGRGFGITMTELVEEVEVGVKGSGRRMTSLGFSQV